MRAQRARAGWIDRRWCPCTPTHMYSYISEMGAERDALGLVSIVVSAVSFLTAFVEAVWVCRHRGNEYSFP